MQENAEMPCKSWTDPAGVADCGMANYPAWFLVNRSKTLYTIILTFAITKMCFMALLLVSVKLAVVSWSSIISYYFILNWTFGLWFVSVAIAFGESARYVYIPYFILGHLVVVNLRGIFQSMNRMNSMSISTNRQTFWVILSTILVFVYVGSCALNYCETRFRSLVITFTTVGYGDLTPKTVPGQIIIIVQLGLAIILLPGLLNELLERIQKEASGGGSFSRGWNSFVVLCGDFQQVKKTVDIIDSIQRRDEVRGEVTTVVLLARRPLPSDLAYRIREYRRRRKVTYILGSGLEPKDLERVQLNFAKAIFVLAKYQSEDAFHEDEHNGLRVWAFDKYAPNVPLYAETRLPDSVELFEDMTSGAICLTSSMQIFLAYSALYRGVGTLLINLLRGTTHLQYDREKQAPWLDYYMDGINNEIYKAPINPIFIGMNFASVSEYLYRHFQVIMTPESDLQMLDSKVVTISNMMNRLFRDHGIVNSPIVELMSETNSAFLAPGSTEFVPRYQRLSRQEQAQKIKPTREYVLSPMFAAGSVLSPAMIESVLTNAYHQPSILNLFNCFAGIRYRVDVEIDAYLNLEGAGTLSCIQVPQEYVGKTFGSLYRGLVRSHGIVPIGLLRDKLSSLRNPLPFVYTNPISCLLLLSHDLVYILGDKTAIMAPLIK
ncbi:hypothetical protein HDV03_004248 [Kappamyces sp. JEL0829]|nr:hypothetical protein HDV03_004248 [Kappamyces sp. JEL0829]